MVNVTDKQIGHLGGPAVYVRGSTPPNPQPPGQPYNAGPVYAQGDGSVTDAASTVEGNVDGPARSAGSESTDGVSGSDRSGGDVSGVASDTTASDGLSGSATGASD